jgi:two-component system response regulator
MAEKIILLVEDDPDDVLLMLRALKKNKICNEVIVAADGAEALDYHFGTGKYAGRELGATPVVTILDLKLPKIDGLEVLRRLRQNPRTALFPVIVLTSSQEESDLVASYRAGANSYVRKPVDFAQFNKAIKHLGLYWLLWNEVPAAKIEE